jgi:hypothetical protein
VNNDVEAGKFTAEEKLNFGVLLAVSVIRRTVPPLTRVFCFRPSVVLRPGAPGSCRSMESAGAVP